MHLSYILIILYHLYVQHSLALIIYYKDLDNLILVVKRQKLEEAENHKLVRVCRL